MFIRLVFCCNLVLIGARLYGIRCTEITFRSRLPYSANLHKPDKMDILLVFKSILLGIIWGGSFLWLASVAVHIFPLPALYRLREMLLNFSVRKYKKNPALGERYWGFSVRFFKFCIFLLWLVILAANAYGLYEIMDSQFPQFHGSSFWNYYGFALALPALLMVWWGIRFLFLGKRTPQMPSLPEDNRPLIEQLL